VPRLSLTARIRGAETRIGTGVREGRRRAKRKTNHTQNIACLTTVQTAHSRSAASWCHGPGKLAAVTISIVAAATTNSRQWLP
jgi:hypothetical protein